MSEIEKLYKNCCFIETIKHHHYSEHRVKNPPFTAAKQLSILKFFANNKVGEERPIIQFHWDDIDEQYFFYFQVPPDCYHAHDKDYDIALAKVVNLVWTKLTPEQQQQIKEILK